MKISDCMKRNVVSISAQATVRDAARLFVQKHIGLLPVLERSGKLVGMVDLRDMLALELPVFVNFIADVDYVHDFGAVERKRPSARVLNKSIKSVMKPAATVEEQDSLLRVHALMLQHNLHDILIVSPDGRLAGVASRVDIGVALLSAWNKGN
jgi:CBS domain-containing protein